MTAIIGPSGSGKSTLLGIILGMPGVRATGQVLVEGRDPNANRSWYQPLLGYVSQSEAVHGSLTARKAIELRGRLRGIKLALADIDEVLRQADLPERCWCRPIASLSGGEAKRVGTAAELATWPSLLAMDEPASGLDIDREAKLVRLLRSMSFRGCTVLVVTHNPQHLDMFDRVLVVRDGRVRFSGPPNDLKVQIPSRKWSDLDYDSISPPCPQSLKAPECAPMQASPAKRRDLGRRIHHPDPPTLWNQTATLCRREWLLLRASWFRRLVVPLGILPAAFAAMIGLAIPPTEHHVLGFFSILACIWLGTSLSLMTIVDEREVFDHERLLFLRLVSYIAAKSVILGAISLMQTGCFFLLLSWIRASVRTDAMLYGQLWCAAYLILTSLAAVGLGLVLSSCSGSGRPFASFLLPLVMMQQIVFSAQVAVHGKVELKDVYGDFQVRGCSQAGCSHRAQHWLPERGGWLCLNCESSSHRDFDQPSSHWWAALFSYATLSRHADIILRSFACSATDFEEAMSSSNNKHGWHATYGYSRWRWEATMALATMAVLLPVASIVCLRLSEHLRPAWARFKLLWEQRYSGKSATPPIARVAQGVKQTHRDSG